MLFQMKSHRLHLKKHINLGQITILSTIHLPRRCLDSDLAPFLGEKLSEIKQPLSNRRNWLLNEFKFDFRIAQTKREKEKLKLKWEKMEKGNEI